jgi:hypothetical protein
MHTISAPAVSCRERRYGSSGMVRSRCDFRGRSRGRLGHRPPWPEARWAASHGRPPQPPASSRTTNGHDSNGFGLGATSSCPAGSQGLSAIGGSSGVTSRLASEPTAEEPLGTGRKDRHATWHAPTRQPPPAGATMRSCGTLISYRSIAQNSGQASGLQLVCAHEVKGEHSR